MRTPKTLQDAVKFFAEPGNCLAYMISIRWPSGVECPTCGRKDVVFLANQHKWQCKSVHHHRQFSVKVGTIFEDSPIPLDKWLVAVWMITNCKNGVSSYEIGRALGVTQKSAWFMLHRIRLAMQNKSLMKLGGSGREIEVDETFIGGKARNMHQGTRLRRHIPGSGYGGKTHVIGLLERGGEIRATVVPNRRRPALQREIKSNVELGSTLYTDNFMSYDKMPPDFFHQFVDHAERYVNGRVHTNGVENFWSLLKRGLKGTYVSVEPFHLFRYVDEQVFRYNNRATKNVKLNDGDRFDMVMSRIAGKRLTFAEVTGKIGTTPEFTN